MDFKAIDQFLNQPHVILGYMSVFLFASAFAVSRASRKEGYKQGQIDAINGRIKYKATIYLLNPVFLICY